MARATGHICDRCKDPLKDKHGRDKTPNTLTVPDSGDYHGKTVELCDDCLAEFKRFLARRQSIPCSHGLKPENVCHHHIPCAGPCETVWR